MLPWQNHRIKEKDRMHLKKSLIVTGRDGHASVLFRLPYHAFCTVCNVNIDISHQGATGNEHSMMHIIRES